MHLHCTCVYLRPLDVQECAQEVPAHIYLPTTLGPMSAPVNVRMC